MNYFANNTVQGIKDQIQNVENEIRFYDSHLSLQDRIQTRWMKVKDKLYQETDKELDEYRQYAQKQTTESLKKEVILWKQHESATKKLEDLYDKLRQSEQYYKIKDLYEDIFKKQTNDNDIVQ